MKNAKEVCLAVKAYFAQQNLKLVDVARMLEASPQTITEHLSGERYFGRTRAHKYAEMFGFNPTYLMTGEGSLLADNHEHVKVESEGDRLLRIIESQQETIHLLAKLANEKPPHHCEG